MIQLCEVYLGPGVTVQTEAPMNRLRLQNANGAVIYLTNEMFQALVHYCTLAEINGYHNEY